MFPSNFYADAVIFRFVFLGHIPIGEMVKVLPEIEDIVNYIQ